MCEQRGPCPVFAGFTLAFALQLRKKHGETSVRVRETKVRLRKPQSEYSIHITKTPTHYKTHTLQNTHTHTHTLQNNIKPPQYKLTQTQCEICANSHNISKCPQSKVTLMYIALLSTRTSP